MADTMVHGPMGRRPYVMVATPCFGGLVTQRYMQSTVALLQFGTAAGWAVSIELLGHDSLITRSRNTLVARFLAKPEATHLLFIDADIGFAPDQVGRMLAFGEDVVAGLYPLKLIDWSPAAMARAVAGEAIETASLRYVGSACTGKGSEARDGFVTGTYAGTGFMLISRAAILRLIEAYPQLRYHGTHTLKGAGPDRDHFALFDCMIDPETGVYLSEDYAFCQRWREIGGRIWLDTQGSLIHVGAHEYHGQPAARFDLPVVAVAAE